MLKRKKRGGQEGSHSSSRHGDHDSLSDFDDDDEGEGGVHNKKSRKHHNTSRGPIVQNLSSFFASPLISLLSSSSSSTDLGCAPPCTPISSSSSSIFQSWKDDDGDFKTPQHNREKIEQQKRQVAKDASIFGGHFLSSFKKLTTHARQQYTRCLSGLRLQSKKDLVLHHVASQQQLPGDDLVDDALRHINQMTLSRDQRQFITACIQACIPIMYGRDFSRHQKRILKRYRLKQITRVVMMKAPRQWGKSVSVAVLASTLMGSCEKVNMIIVSVRMRSASDLLEQCKNWFLERADGKDRLVSSNKHEFIVKSPSCPTSYTTKMALASGLVNRITCISATVSSIRGAHPDVIFADEANFIDEDVISKGLAPMLSNAGRTFFAISTVTKSGTWFARTIRRGLESPHLAAIFNVSLVCPDCKLKAGNNAKEKSRCVHMQHIKPPWKGSGGGEIVGLLMKDAATMAQESMGEITDENAHVLREDSLMHFQQKDLKYCRAEGANRTILTFIDPCGSDSKTSVSDCGIVSIVRDEMGIITIVGIEAAPAVTVRAIRALMQSYFQRFEDSPIFKKANHVVMVEKNYGGTGFADHFIMYARKAIPRLREGSTTENKAGVWQSSTSKVQGVNRLQGLVDLNLLSWGHQICTSQKEHFKTELLRQMRALRAVPTPRGNVTYTAKPKDDLVISLISVIYFSELRQSLQEKKRLFIQHNRRLIRQELEQSLEEDE